MMCRKSLSSDSVFPAWSCEKKPTEFVVATKDSALRASQKGRTC